MISQESYLRNLFLINKLEFVKIGDTRGLPEIIFCDRFQSAVMDGLRPAS